MRNNDSKRIQSLPYTEECQVLVTDIVGYLSGLAKLHEAEKTGNIRLSVGLRQLVEVLRPYANVPVSELSEVLKQPTLQTKTKHANRQPKVTLPFCLENLGQREIEGILGNDSYTKDQIAELGVKRFGISRSKLSRLRKRDAQESIRAALENEKALDVISREARISGRARSA